MTRADQIFESFAKFHRENPAVWAMFQGLTKKLIAAGHKHYSADAVCHQIRWHYSIENVVAKFKLNNNHVCHFARLFEVAYPDNADFFRKRHRPSKHRNERGEGFESQNAEEQIDDQMREQLLKLL